MVTCDNVEKSCFHVYSLGEGRQVADGGREREEKRVSVRMSKREREREGGKRAGRQGGRGREREEDRDRKPTVTRVAESLSSSRFVSPYKIFHRVRSHFSFVFLLIDSARRI